MTKLATNAKGLAMAKEAVMNIRLPFSTKVQTWTDRLQINGWDSSLNERYAEALIAELKANADEFTDARITAIRLGGGQASHVGGPIIWSIIKAVGTHYHLIDNVSITMRCSGADFSGASMPYFKRGGITRFDLEMLSLSSTAFNRVNQTDSLKLYPILCNSFLHSETNNSLGLVLVAGHPKSSNIETRRSFLAAGHYNVAHVIVEPYAGEGRNNRTIRLQVNEARQVLHEQGFREYSPLHFARNGQEDAYFLKKAHACNIIGIGLGAQTRFEGAVSVNTTDLSTYLNCSHDFTKITADIHPDYC